MEYISIPCFKWRHSTAKTKTTPTDRMVVVGTLVTWSDGLLCCLTVTTFLFSLSLLFHLDFRDICCDWLFNLLLMLCSNSNNSISIIADDFDALWKDKVFDRNM